MACQSGLRVPNHLRANGKCTGNSAGVTCPGADEAQPDGLGSGLSITELVKKNADLRDKLRVERSKNAQLDLDMEQVSLLPALTAQTYPCDC